jgi:hypothetical protein
MLLRKHQCSRCHASVDALAKLVLAHELQPLQVIPIRRDEQMLSHGNGITFVQLRKLVEEVVVRVSSSRGDPPSDSIASGRVVEQRTRVVATRKKNKRLR